MANSLKILAEVALARLNARGRAVACPPPLPAPPPPPLPEKGPSPTTVTARPRSKTKQTASAVPWTVRTADPSPHPTQTGKHAGRWSALEHQRFLGGLKLHGRRWADIARLVGTRTVTQVRTHAQKYFLKLQKQGLSCPMRAS